MNPYLLLGGTPVLGHLLLLVREAGKLEERSRERQAGCEPTFEPAKGKVSQQRNRAGSGRDRRGVRIEINRKAYWKSKREIDRGQNDGP
jgi:hypothetical protein